MENKDNIVAFDFQGWPVEKISLETIIEQIGGVYNKKTGNYEIPKDKLQVTPKIYTDDGMGYATVNKKSNKN